MSLQNGLKSLADKFQKLPTWGKVTAVAGLGTGCYLLFFKGKEQETSGVEPNIYYPYADSGTLDFTGVGGAEDNTMGGSLGGGGSSGGLTIDDLNSVQDNVNAWGSSIMESLGQVYNRETNVTDTIPMGDNANTINTPSPDYRLYAAQVAYGKATTAAERQAAAAAGQAARAEGATDEGANSIWAKNKTSGSSGSNKSSSKKSPPANSIKVISSGSSSDGKIYSKGGSGKEFVYNPGTGNIGVTKNGKTTYIKPGDKNYNSTKNAMEADTGRKF